MVTMLFGNAYPAELQTLVRQARDLISRVGNEDWTYQTFTSSQKALEFLEGNGLIDIACVDVVMDKGLSLAEGLRQANRHTLMALVADCDTPPTSYMKPSIFAAALLLRPYTKQQADEVLGQLLALYAEKAGEAEDVFVLSSRGERRLIPHSHIHYFEARDKKIILNAGSMEYVFYDTIDNLEAELPPIFVRCHRSFIVQTGKISQIRLSRNVVVLEDGSEIPLSRTYKPAFKAE